MLSLRIQRRIAKTIFLHKRRWNGWCKSCWNRQDDCRPSTWIAVVWNPSLPFSRIDMSITLIAMPYTTNGFKSISIHRRSWYPFWLNSNIVNHIRNVQTMQMVCKAYTHKPPQLDHYKWYVCVCCLMVDNVAYWLA